MGEIIFWCVVIYIGIPIMFESVNKLLWRQKFFVINLLVATISVISIFFLKQYIKPQDQELLGMMATPLLFLSLYKLCDYWVLKKYNRHFIITNRSMSKASWGYNWLDQTLSVIIFLGSILGGLFLSEIIF